MSVKQRNPHGPWFRVYTSILNNRKILRLTDAQGFGLMKLMAVATDNGGLIPPELSDIAGQLRYTLGKTRDLLQVLISGNLMERTPEGYIIHDWEQMQFQSDVSTERVRAFRKRQRNVSETPSEKQSTENIVPSSEAKASSDGASRDLVDLKKRVWNEAKALGIQKSAIGQMFKLCGQDTAALHALILRCKENHVIGRAMDPTSWCMAELHPKPTGPPNGSGNHIPSDDDKRKALENLNKFMDGT